MEKCTFKNPIKIFTDLVKKILKTIEQAWANPEKFSVNPENTDNYF